MAYGRRNRFVVPAVDDFLGKTGLTLNELHSTLGRIAARAIETKVIADAMNGWLNQLASGQSAYTQASIPAAAIGCGLNEAPRGALGHWISISGGKIGNYSDGRSIDMEPRPSMCRGETGSGRSRSHRHNGQGPGQTD